MTAQSITNVDAVIGNSNAVELAGTSNSKDIKVLFEEAFFEDESTGSQFRLRVCEFPGDGLTRVGLSRFWWHKFDKRWVPSAKSHCYLPPAAWRALSRVHNLALEHLPNEPTADGTVDVESCDTRGDIKSACAPKYRGIVEGRTGVCDAKRVISGNGSVERTSTAFVSRNGRAGGSACTATATHVSGAQFKRPKSVDTDKKQTSKRAARFIFEYGKTPGREGRGRRTDKSECARADCETSSNVDRCEQEGEGSK